MNLQNLFKNKTFSAVLLVGLFIIAGFLFLNESKTTPRDLTQNTEEVRETEERERPKFKEPNNILNELALDTSTLNTQLSAVDGSGSVGEAYLLFRDNMTLHAVVAQLPEPAEGVVYEGWLVRPNPLAFFSTGVMKKQDEGTWLLEYARAGDYPAYTRVVITEEEVLDGTPEKHIIEGDFK